MTLEFWKQRLVRQHLYYYDIDIRYYNKELTLERYNEIKCSAWGVYYNILQEIKSLENENT
jgi:hypothetical protein